MRFEFTCTDGVQKQTYEGFQKAFVRTTAFPLVMAVATIEGQAET